MSYQNYKYVRILIFMLSLSIISGAGIAMAHRPDNHNSTLPALELASLIEPIDATGSSYSAALPPAQGGVGLQATCTGGTAPSRPGPVTLDLCYQHNFSVGGNPRSIRVWYITDTTVYNVDGKSYSHWVQGESQAQQVAEAAEDSWKQYYADSGHEPYLTGCGGVLNIWLEDGKGWAGIAYWGTSGNCRIGIDAPMINDGVSNGDRRVVAHEVAHYMSYSYDDGCYDDFRPLYPGDSEYVEGGADVWMNSVSVYADPEFNMMGSYAHLSSMYDKSYGNSFLTYFTQQLGTVGAPGDSHYHIDAQYAHYDECNAQDDIYVIDDVILNLSSGSKTKKWFFVDFFAANYAHFYADAGTQPELVYSDVDDAPTSGPSYSQDVTLSSGSQNWTESTPDDWAARYYRIRPSGSCDFVQLDVETTNPGDEVGINLMGADTAAPTQVIRSAHIGDKATRFFSGSLDELVVVVNSFDTAAVAYDVTATCVSPSLNILEPLHNPGHVMVGSPTSPIAFLTRFEVTSSGLPVSGIPESSFSFDAEGDAATAVAGSVIEVGPGEYWGVVNPPNKPGGTTFVDYQVCLNSTFCDTEADALLYVDPGNTDTVLLFDESGSMATEDTPGEGKRIDNAKKAGKVMPDLLRDGDRIGIIGFGAEDNPPGCGLPPDGSGTGNCPNDNITRLARINDVSVPGDITIAKAGVDAVTDRVVWTNIGQGLIDAKDMLLANPGNTNPDTIVLLSDGRENVNPLYDTPDVKGKLQDAGVCVDTIGLGPEAPGALLAQIAADNCGTYRPVPTSGLGTTIVSLSPGEVRTSLRVDEVLKTLNGYENLQSAGAADRMVGALAASAPFLPGQLSLADTYDQFDAQAQDASRLFHTAWVGTPTSTWKEGSAQVDKTTSFFQFVVAGKQPDSIYVRLVEVLPPGADPVKGWIPISPPQGVPANWDVRNSDFEDTLLVTEPEPGEWRFRTMYLEIVSDFIMNLSVQSDIRLRGRLLNLNRGQADAGDIVPIIGTLMTRDGLIKVALMAASVENEGGTDIVSLFDDGQHDDGAAGDGIFGWPYSLTEHGGSYSVRLLAFFFDPADNTTLMVREWNGGFWVDGPQEEGGDYQGDKDGDGMPDDWERRCKLDTRRDDSQEDFDRDGLTNIAELGAGTSPCQPDTDRGGELDGSEVRGGRNPLWAPDDKVHVVGHLELRPLDQRIWINWRQKGITETMRVYVTERPGDLGSMVELGNSGEFVLDRLPTGQSPVNGTPYYLIFQRFNPQEEAEGAYSDQYEVVPKEDPIPPQGAYLMTGTHVISGGDVTTSRNVILEIDATDLLSYEGPASHSAGHSAVNPQLMPFMETVSGVVEMRFSNSPEGIITSNWEPFANTKPWTLGCTTNGEICFVYGQFKDKAGNESLVLPQSIILRIDLAGGEGNIYLPIILKNE